jgi:hypothetical protein
MVVTFDTLKASRQLQQAGFDEAKAEVLASLLAERVAANPDARDDCQRTHGRWVREAESARAPVRENLSAPIEDPVDCWPLLYMFLGACAVSLILAMALCAVIILAAI